MDWSRYAKRATGAAYGRRTGAPDYACQLWQRMHGGDSLPPASIDAHALAPAAHLQMQVAIQPYSDNAIAKTINTPADLDFAAYRSVFESGYAMGLKGCTMFRPNPVTGSALSSGPEADVRHTVVTSRTRPASRRSIFR